MIELRIAARGNRTASSSDHLRGRPAGARSPLCHRSKQNRDQTRRAAETLESGLAKTVCWYCENRRWWQDILDVGRFYGTANRQLFAAVIDLLTESRCGDMVFHLGDEKPDIGLV
jgi:hypothetical protein